MVDLRKIVGFEWDEWNIDKSYKKHGIRPDETEEVFLDKDVQIERDIKHQEKEERYIAIGKTVEDKILFVVFTMRNYAVRIISGRRSNKKERRLYEEGIKKNSKI
ncbi:MAG: hypothetical protein A3D74_01285 [Candidatus Levybacteria bacterium RIFCSPHIGHO2_02_FULL_37_13]|nr:MAG: hypothetical protein A3D74_01285 [Candidatus Levybacteria bacterium RIFCSPHIGHO2_02_FULL_37_13]OGH30633.1 MAG: hypothetical protein A3E40_02120 [Candidatus Levybacteria bacterium RIFCSPHIGHO2_12_FULL_37_9]OGH39662.1 MAG: hypothetical protein A3B41_02160 [Candidatus Levybacteria bacterium RIFCSPLOWO2_01_FULL_37_26]